MAIKVFSDFLPPAKDVKLGAIKVGETLDINDQGTLEVSSYMNVMARTTNAITEIPYELNVSIVDGKFSARAGTRYSFANNIYNLLPTDQEITANITGQRYVCVDTNTNLVLSTSYNVLYSLPIAKITITSGVVTSIDELYPGFGHTDTTVFVLPGVKGMYPAGRLDNGGLHNQKFEYTIAKNVAVSSDGTFLVGCNGTDIVLLSTETEYDADLNVNVYNNASVNYAICGKVVVSSGKITKFIFRPCFHAADYYDLIANYSETADFGDLAWKDKVGTSDIASGGIAQSAVTGLETALSQKQPMLTWDDVPVENSDNPVKSGGIYNKLAEKQPNLTPGTGIDITNNVISEASIAYVNYGTGLYADITDLITNKKIILCKYNNSVYQYTCSYTSSNVVYYYFTCLDTYSTTKYLRVDPSSDWINGGISIQSTITGAATTITSSNLTTNRAVISNASGKIAVSDTTSTELGYVHGVTSDIQTQINNKVTKNNDITGATYPKITYDSKGLVTGGSSLAEGDIPSIPMSRISDVTATATEINVLDGITASTTELNYVDGVTSSIQTQLDNKVTKNNDITAATHTKITYDAKGLVTSGSDLQASDIPSITLSKISDVTATATELNVLDGITASTAELNILDGVTATTSEINVLDGITASTTELNYVDGVTSSIQTQLNNKQGTISDLETIRTGAGKGATALQSSDIIDTTSSTATDKALSANMGKDLQEQINDLKAVGRFLSIWNCVTGRPTSEPEVLPYVYNTGDYFLVGTVATEVGQVNYKPNGSSYTGATSTTVETETVKVADMYYYDGTNWQLSQNSQRTVSFADIAGQPSDNTNLNTALNAKVTGNEAITAGTHTKITYDSKGLVTAGADLAESDIPGLSPSKITGVTASVAELNILDGVTANASELNILDGATLSTTELNYVDGVTSNIQTQLNNKVEANSAITGATHTKITYDSKGLVTAGADITLSDVTDVTATATEVNYLSGVTSSIQTQLNNKANSSELSNYQPLITSSAKLDADLLSEGSNNKLVSQAEKNTWNGKQNALTPGTNITISSDTISTSAAQVIIRRYA